MRKMRKSIAVTEKESKHRFAQLMPVVSATGRTLCFLAMVYDTKVQKPDILKVSDYMCNSLLKTLVGR